MPEVENASNYILLGDFNISLLDPNLSTSKFVCHTSLNGFSYLINYVTRPTSSLCIDHTHSRFSNSFLKPCYIFNVQLDVSDHNLIGVILKISPHNNVQLNTRWFIFHYDFTKLNVSLRDENLC